MDFETMVREALSETFKEELRQVIREEIRKEISKVFYGKAIRSGTRAFVVEVLNALAKEFREDVEGATAELKEHIDIQKKIKNSLTLAIDNLSADMFSEIILSSIKDKIES